MCLRGWGKRESTGRKERRCTKNKGQRNRVVFGPSLMIIPGSLPLDPKAKNLLGRSTRASAIKNVKKGKCSPLSAERKASMNWKERPIQIGQNQMDDRRNLNSHISVETNLQK